MSFLLLLILQIAVVLTAARAVGMLFRRINQPQVMGEMVAGILLGPSLLGWLAPDFSATLFPAASLGFLNAVSQVGLLFFMFLVGVEFDPKLLRGRGHTAVVTSHASIVVPFFLGSALALYLYPRLSDSSVDFTGFALFMGAAMSVTAFPVLARILSERNLTHSRVGAITIACAAVDDVTAWTILAVVVAIVRASAVETPLWLTFAGTGVYIVAMLLIVRRGLAWLESFYHTRGKLTQDAFAGVLLLLLASAWTTEWLGIHALFGAFALGAVMPKEPGLVHELTGKLEDVTVVFLLPLFFAFTGLRTSIGLVDEAEMWMYAGLILMVAVAGKFGGSTIAARMTGLTWRESGALGILMNTRGLMELVILNIGLELGVISPALFTMMVMMALITTFMTTPVLEWIYPARMIREATLREESYGQDYTIVIPVSLSASGPALLRAALATVPDGRQARVYALHLERTSEHSLTRVDPTPLYNHGAVLGPLLETADKLGVEVRTLSFASRNVARDIVEVAKVKRADLIFMGWHKPVIGRSILSGTVSDVLKEAEVEVGVLVDKGISEWRHILVPYRDASDLPAISMARRIATAMVAEATILHVAKDHSPGNPGTLPSSWAESSFPERVRLKLVEDREPLQAAVREAAEGYDLIIVGVSDAWGTAPSLFGQRDEELAEASPASLLVVRPGKKVEATSTEGVKATATARA